MEQVNGIADDLLRNGFERWQRLEGEKQAISDDLKELFAELKGQGFDGKALRAAFRQVEKAGDASVEEHNATVDLYVGSLMAPRPGVVGTVPATHTRAAREASDPLAALRSNKDLAIVEAANLQPKSEPQPTKAAGQASNTAAADPSAQQCGTTSLPGAEGAEDRELIPENQLSQAAGGDLTASSPSGQVATPYQAKASTDGGTTEQDIKTPADSVTGDASRASVGAGTDALNSAASATVDAQEDAAGAGSNVPAAPKYAASGVVVWEHTPPEPVQRHPYSAAFGDMGQDLAVIDDDIAGAKSEPIVRVGNEILDGWARYNCARGMIGGSGISTEYPVKQYDGDNALVDCIRWNVTGRIMTDKQKQLAAKRLIEIEPKRKAEILATFEALSA